MHIYGIYNDGTNEPICRAAMETQTERTDLETWWGKERMRGMEEEHENLDVIPYVK